MLIGCRPPSGHFSCTLGRLGSGIWVYGLQGLRNMSDCQAVSSIRRCPLALFLTAKRLEAYTCIKPL